MSTLREEVEQSWLAANPKWQVSDEIGDFRTRMVSVSTGGSKITFTRENEVRVTISGLFGFNELDVTLMLIVLGVSAQRFGVADYLAWSKQVDRRFSKLLSTQGRRPMIRALNGSGEVLKEFIFSEFAYEAAQFEEKPRNMASARTRPPIVSHLARSGFERKTVQLNSLIVELPSDESGTVMFRTDQDRSGSQGWHSLQDWARLLWRVVIGDDVQAQLHFLNKNLVQLEIMLGPKHFGSVSNLLARSSTIEQRVRRAWESL